MSTALELLSNLSLRGGCAWALGDCLRVRAPKGAVPPDLLENLRRHKMEVLAVLRPLNAQVETHPHNPSGASESHDWDATDWRAFYEERAAIVEYEGGLERVEAERLAFEWTLVHWLYSHPPTSSSPDVCVGCGKALIIVGKDGMPLLTGRGGHVWIHHKCFQRYMEIRRGEALKALAEGGLVPPEGSSV